MTPQARGKVGDAAAGGEDGLFSMAEVEEQFRLALLEEHRATEVQLEAERADVIAVTALLADPDLVTENRAVYASVQSARTVKRER